MLFVDDIVPFLESREEINEKLDLWRQALEAHNFHINKSKVEYMECKFSSRRMHKS